MGNSVGSTRHSQTILHPVQITNSRNDKDRLSQASRQCQLYGLGASQIAVQPKQGHVMASCAYPLVHAASVRTPPVREGVVSTVVTPRTQKESVRAPAHPNMMVAHSQNGP